MLEKPLVVAVAGVGNTRSLPSVALYGSVFVVVLSMVVTVLRLTTHSTTPQNCPQCGAKYQPGDVVKRPQETYAMCRRCTHTVTGPVSRDFSWAGAVEHWLEK